MHLVFNFVFVEHNRVALKQVFNANPFDLLKAQLAIYPMVYRRHIQHLYPIAQAGVNKFVLAFMRNTLIRYYYMRHIIIINQILQFRRWMNGNSFQPFAPFVLVFIKKTCNLVLSACITLNGTLCNNARFAGTINNYAALGACRVKRS